MSISLTDQVQNARRVHKLKKRIRHSPVEVRVVREVEQDLEEVKKMRQQKRAG